ncbi:unnamed protein product [Meloidogyne enterolobii]|uniref:Uncharacterized protein n=1 Tax=Meloidogyne enterolobii TaxID=390850 RepID=A0ACB0XQS3_MELEN
MSSASEYSADLSSSLISGYTNYCSSCNQNSNIFTSSSSSTTNSRKSSRETVSPTYLLSTTSSGSLESLRAPAEVFKLITTKTYQIMKDQIDNNRELRSKIKDDDFIQQQLSLLSPGIDNSEKRFLVHKFTRSAMLLPDFNDYQRLSPLINALVNEVDTNDLLGCSTALEMLADIASSKQENINYFESIGLLQKIYKLFQTTKEDTDMGITHTACIRFFGYLSTTDSNALEKFPIFTSDVFDAIYHFDSLDPLRRKLAFETFAVVTKTIGAKRFLSSENCIFINFSIYMKIFQKNPSPLAIKTPKK